MMRSMQTHKVVAMTRPVPLALICLAALTAATPALAQTVMKPGGWEMTTGITRELPGQPAESLGRHTLKICLTPEFLAADPYLRPNLDDQRMAARQAKCTASGYQREGDSAQWAMECTVADGSTLRAQISNHAELDRLTTRMVQDVERPGGSKGRVTMAGEGRYVGDCTEDMTKPTPPVRPKS